MNYNKAQLLMNRAMGGGPTKSNPVKSGFKRARLNKNGLFKGSMVKSTDETKFFDVTATAATVNTSANVVQLLNTAQGDDDINRIGKTIKLKSILIRAINRSTASTGLAQSHRVILYYDKLGDTNNTAPTALQILEANTVYSPLNSDNTKRFVILMDKIMNIGARTGGVGGSDPVQTWKMFKKLPGLEAKYNSTTASIPISGAIGMLIVGSEAAGTTAGTMDYYVRIRFQG